MKHKIIVMLIFISTIFGNLNAQIYSKNHKFSKLKKSLQIGDYYQGGIIFYLDKTKNHGLICAVKDESSDATWGCFEKATKGANGTAIGTGYQNTQDILKDTYCATGSAASFCNIKNQKGLTLTVDNNWFLPAIDELKLMYKNRAKIDATAKKHRGYAFKTQTGLRKQKGLRSIKRIPVYYWSSTENSVRGITATILTFKDGAVSYAGKSGRNYVRAVKFF